MAALFDLFGTRLTARVIDDNRPGDQFRAVHGFGDWLAAGDAALDATRAEVEPKLVRYLAGAEATGRRWGTVVGILVGAGMAVVVVVVIAVYAVIA